ncbi:MAG: family 10 glycosylhydrolase, partial [Oscillospiraceae bacterium]|nr:family 10 glycosylhydrolase [Oscillospiraceae bacterium]
MLNNIKNAGFNTVYVHVRPYNDAYYNSEIFPRAEYYSGEMEFDPFEIIVDEGHKVELSIHSWINPLRCQTDAQLKELNDKYIIKQWYNDKSKNGTYIIKINDRWYLNPAYEEVRNYVISGVQEIAEKYNIDGVHIP